MKPYEILEQISRYFWDNPEQFDSRENWVLSCRTMVAMRYRMQRRDPEGREQLNKGVTI